MGRRQWPPEGIRVRCPWPWIPKAGVTPVSRRVSNLSNLVRQAAQRHPQEIAVAWGEATWSWAVFDRRIDAMAAALAARGVAKGDRVLVQSNNCNQMFEAMFACFRLGAVYVPTNFRQSPDEVADLGPDQRRLDRCCAAARLPGPRRRARREPGNSLQDRHRRLSVWRGLRCDR